MTGRTVLLAEDDDSVRAVGRRALEQAGYEVLEASDGQAALQIASEDQRRIDVLVTDVGMPALNGPDLAERLESLRPGIRVLYITGYDRDVQTTRSHHISGAPTLLKPFTPEELQGAVDDLLSRPDTHKYPRRGSREARGVATD